MPGGRTVTELEKRAVFVAIKLIEKVIFTFFFFFFKYLLFYLVWPEYLTWDRPLRHVLRIFPRNVVLRHMIKYNVFGAFKKCTKCRRNSKAVTLG